MAQPIKTPTADLKPGSNPADAAALSGEHDFGVREGDTVERAYASANTKAADHGAAQPHDYEHAARRDHGAGVRDTGPGSGSAGDVDTDIVGLGGVGLSSNIDKQSATDARDTDGISDNAASGGHAAGENQTLVGQVGGRHPQVNVVTPGDSRTTDTGADQIDNTSDTQIDDSFRGEISSAEASGRDTLGR